MESEFGISKSESTLGFTVNDSVFRAITILAKSPFLFDEFITRGVHKIIVATSVKEKELALVSGVLDAYFYHHSKWGLSLVVGWRSITVAYAHDYVTAIIVAVCAFVIIEGL